MNVILTTDLSDPPTLTAINQITFILDFQSVFHIRHLRTTDVHVFIFHLYDGS